MIKKRMILVCLLALLPIRAFSLEPIVVTGKVTDEAGMPLPGVNASVLLDNRLGLNLTYYYQRTEDVIYPLPKPPSTGFLAQFENAGTITNRGLELGLNARPLNKKQAVWFIDATYARNRNKVTELPGTNFVELGIWGNSVTEGKPVGVFRGLDFVRFGRDSVVDSVEIDNEYSSWQVGDLYIADDGYPIVDPELRLIGDPNPDWTGSVRNSVTLFNNVRES